MLAKLFKYALVAQFAFVTTTWASPKTETKKSGTRTPAQVEESYGSQAKATLLKMVASQNEKFKFVDENKNALNVDALVGRGNKPLIVHSDPFTYEYRQIDSNGDMKIAIGVFYQGDMIDSRSFVVDPKKTAEANAALGEQTINSLDMSLQKYAAKNEGKMKRAVAQAKESRRGELFKGAISLLCILSLFYTTGVAHAFMGSTPSQRLIVLGVFAGVVAVFLGMLAYYAPEFKKKAAENAG